MKKIIPIILLIFIYLSSLSQGTSVSESFINNLKLAHPVFNTKYNPQNRDLYFYSRLNNANTGFFVYDLDNEVVTNYIELDQPIGDLEYNPVQGHVLVSEYADVGGSANIRVFDAYDNYNELNPINFSDVNNPKNYPTEIFCAPNGKIYIALNMLSDEYSPEIAILDAKYYINVVNEPLPSGFTEHIADEEFLSHFSSIMHFCYNPYNESVYFVVGGNYTIFSPYQITTNNGIFPDNDVNFIPIGQESRDGFLKEITKNNEININSKKTVQIPGEIICATPDNVPLNYQGKLYILGNNDQTYLYSYDCSTNELSEIDIPNVFDIDYNPTENCIYVYQYILNLNDNIPNESWIKILKVNNDNTIDETPLYNELGIASSITYNEYDNKLYLHYISDYRVMGHDPMQIIAIDVDNPANQDIYTSPNTCLFPEIISITNYPFFDPYTSKAFFPNGMQSSIGIFDFTPREKLPLVFGENKDLWMSVPRMENNMTDEYDEGDYVETVFDKDRFGIPYATFELLYTNPDGDNEEASWDASQNWSHNFTTTNSYKGFIMKLNSLEDNYLYMYGQIKDPATLFPIYPQKTNPIGYFLPQEQDVFDALGTTTLSLIDEIRSQNYYCEKQEGIIPYGPTGGNVGQIESYYWVCDKHQTNINYGDMIMVRSSQTGTEADEIQWQNGPGVVREKIRPKTEYFSYEQVNNYTPFIIELNYDVNPLELGAFINSKCVGATALMSEDSIVFMRVYLDGADPDSIVFQDWNGTKSSGNGIIREYKVFNELTKTNENRILNGNIGTNKVRISFKNANNNSNNDNEINNNSFMIWPNPANNKLFFSIQIDESTLSKIELLDISGRKIALLYSGVLKQGYNSGNINLGDQSIKAGIYFVKINAGSLIQTKKIIINK